jgi:hypothetical protein
LARQGRLWLGGAPQRGGVSPIPGHAAARSGKRLGHEHFDSAFIMARWTSTAPASRWTARFVLPLNDMSQYQEELLRHEIEYNLVSVLPTNKYLSKFSRRACGPCFKL